jgi:hypothetical protein
MSVRRIVRMTAIIEAIDAEISRLQQVRSLLAQSTGIGTKIATAGRKAGRPAKKAKRTLSPEARAKIAAAQKKRWAAAKKAVK